mmetsp:Transcript_13388/g.36298  ORF Transcript_13388/g.36298 Transcript_13388/m.36298 type:complete len:90 (+) Transcript_13388:316-585(+)
MQTQASTQRTHGILMQAQKPPNKLMWFMVAILSHSPSLSSIDVGKMVFSLMLAAMPPPWCYHCSPWCVFAKGQNLRPDTAHKADMLVRL